MAVYRLYGEIRVAPDGAFEAIVYAFAEGTSSERIERKRCPAPTYSLAGRERRRLVLDLANELTQAGHKVVGMS